MKDWILRMLIDFFARILAIALTALSSFSADSLVMNVDVFISIPNTVIWVFSPSLDLFLEIPSRSVTQLYALFSRLIC